MCIRDSYLDISPDELKAKAFDFSIEVAGKQIMSGKRINAKVVADFSKQKSKGIKVDSDEFIGQILAEDIVDTRAATSLPNNTNNIYLSISKKKIIFLKN